ncbi:unnamed protein product, partial [marine sediment metagenome]
PRYLVKHKGDDYNMRKGNVRKERNERDKKIFAILDILAKKFMELIDGQIEQLKRWSNPIPLKDLKESKDWFKDLAENKGKEDPK